MLAKLTQISAELAEFKQGFQQGMEWYKTQIDTLKYQLQLKDREIEDLKKQLNEKSS